MTQEPAHEIHVHALAGEVHSPPGPGRMRPASLVTGPLPDLRHQGFFLVLWGRCAPEAGGQPPEA